MPAGADLSCLWLFDLLAARLPRLMHVVPIRNALRIEGKCLACGDGSKSFHCFQVGASDEISAHRTFVRPNCPGMMDAIYQARICDNVAFGSFSLCH